LTAFSFSNFSWERLATSCIRGETKTSTSTKHNSRRAVMPYQDKFVHLFGDLLEILHVVNRQERIIQKIFGDDVLVSSLGHQQISRVA
jgi:hypothetical protein